ncbi:MULTISPECIES: hypothetical protein [Acinetobacter]|uniref:hypothetical protein n=1 Tax=Acinetobacter TaxID=469 RepID=UPI001371264B|nr:MULTISPECIES: hypothetical protein [Acinetobacter]MDS7958851.1 hypothetical protein [Acinetobacter sp. V104_13]MDS7982980.1 hypothetical protein [Acinetobacter sp. V104_3]MZY04843.1 hypothetical protein [Acinetobacter pittii]
MSHLQKVAADKQSLGFEFQDFVFIEKLIELRPEQSLGLEVYDDIHVTTNDDNGVAKELLLIQVKHSIDASNISDRDIDIWKTFYNWLKLVPELPSHLQLKFQLYTNKKLNNQEFVSLLKYPSKNLKEILNFINKTHQDISEAELKKKPSDSSNPIAKYVKAIAEASDEHVEFIFTRFEFHSDNSAIINRISLALRQLAIPVSRIDETRKYIVGSFKESKFSRIIKGEKVEITFDIFRNEMGFDRIIRSARALPADFDEFLDMYYDYQRPDTLSFRSSKFHDQLKDIGIDDEEIVDRGIEMMLAEEFMKSLEDAGSFSASENKRLEYKAISDWKLIHNQIHRTSTSDNEDKNFQAALDCYYQTMRSSLKAGNVELPLNLSCGKYIKLSNLPRIGWRKDWKGKFE